MKKTASQIAGEVLIKCGEGVLRLPAGKPVFPPRLTTGGEGQYSRAQEPHIRRVQEKVGPLPLPKTILGDVATSGPLRRSGKADPTADFHTFHPRHPELLDY